MARITIVEDEVLIADDLKCTLEKWGHKVVGPFTSGEDAIEDFIRREKSDEPQPDLVLMDIILAGKLDGIGTAMQLRKKFGIPVIFVSAYFEHLREAKEKTKLVQPFGFVGKPIGESSDSLKFAIDIALDRLQQELDSKKEIETYRSIAINVPVGLFTIDGMGNYTFVNLGWSKLTGFSLSEATGKRWLEIVHREHKRRVYNAWNRALKNQRDFRSSPFMLSRDDKEVWVLADIVTELNKEGEIVYHHGSIVDITAQKKDKDKLEAKLLTDDLTGLKNEKGFKESLTLMIKELEEDSGLAVYYLDLDGFKSVNDKFGHSAGDEVLKNFASIIKRILRRGSDIIARKSGDEFLAVAEVKNIVDAKKFAESIIKETEASCFSVLESKEDCLPVTVSVGITLLKSREDLQDALDRADSAMYKSKEAGGNRHTVHEYDIT